MCFTVIAHEIQAIPFPLGAWCTTTGYTYDQTAAACYKVVSTPAGWTDADGACKADKGHLLKVNNDARYSFLVSQISKFLCALFRSLLSRRVGWHLSGICIHADRLKIRMHV